MIYSSYIYPRYFDKRGCLPCMKVEGIDGTYVITQDVITTSNYQATPELLKREPTAPSYDYLAKRALELCQEAVIKTNTKTKYTNIRQHIHFLKV